MVIAVAVLIFQPICAPVFAPRTPLAVRPAAIAAISAAATAGDTDNTGAIAADDSPAKTPVQPPQPSNPQPSAETTSYLPGMLEPKAASASGAANAVPSDPAPQPILLAQPKPASAARVSTKRWWALSAAMHGAATFDAYSTRRFMLNGTGYELNPALRPIAGSPAIYAAIQIVPVALDFVSRKMMHSENPALRKFWWMPQSIAATSSFICAAHNMTLH